jgi:flagellin
MIGINSNINSLVAQQNLNSTQSALSSAITRLSSGKRINTAADDAAGQAIASRMTSQINGLNQGVSNANDGVSMTQTASSGLSQISDNLQRIRQLSVQSATGSLSANDQAALQKEVTQRIAEVNRIASQTTYNGTNVLDGSAGNVSFQVGANVGQTISVDLSHSVSAANLGTGTVAKGSVLGTMTGLSLDAKTGNAAAAGSTATLTSINVLADGKGGFSFTDQNNQALSSTAVNTLFGGAAATTGTGTSLKLQPQGALTNGASVSQTSSIAAIQASNTQVSAGGFAGSGTTLSTISLTTNPLKSDLSGEAAGGTITSIQVKADGAGGYTFKALDSGGNDITSSVDDGTDKGGAALAKLFTQGTASGTTPATLALSSAGKTALGTTDAGNASANISAATSANYIAPTYQSGFAKAGTSLGTLTTTTNPIKADLSAEAAAGTIKSIQAVADGNGGMTFKALDAGGADITSTVTDGAGTTGSAALAKLFTTTAATGSTAGSISGLKAAGTTAFGADAGGLSFTTINTTNAATKPTKLGTVAVNLDANGDASSPGATPSFTSVNVYADGKGGYTFAAVDATGTESTSSTVNNEVSNLFTVGSSNSGTAGKTLAGAGSLAANPNATAAAAGLTSVASNNVPPKVSDIDISSTAGANQAIEAVDNALNTVNTIQASLGAAQNRFTSIASTQTQQATNLSSAQSQVTDANFAQETANLSKAQVLQQAGISVLAQANSMPQQVLKLLG